MSKPLILTFSGLDPTGGAGIAADIRAISQAGSHCLPIITALTMQDTRNATKFTPVAVNTLREQLDTLLADVSPAAIKIGLVADAACAALIRDTCAGLADIPVVADPVLRAGGGGALTTGGMVGTWRELLLPCVTLATPNEAEFAALFPDGSLSSLQTQQRLLVTGADRQTDPIRHRLLSSEGELRTYSVERLPHQYHGSGCTLAAAIAARLAQGLELEAAIASALAQTQEALRSAFRPGRGQWLPC